MKMNKQLTFALVSLLALSACNKKSEDTPKDSAAEALKAEVNPTDSQTPGAPSVKVLPPPAPRLTKSDICPQKVNKTSDGICSCFYGGYNFQNLMPEAIEKYLRPDGSDVLGNEFECSITRGEDDCVFATAAVCTKLRGCMTLDGRWYPALSKAAFTYRHSFRGLPHYAKEDGLLANRFTSRSDPYVVPGGMDITLESTSYLGDCVLDRTDGIPLLSTLDKPAQPYACDRPTCACGDQTCKHGEICKDDKCTPDVANPLELNDSNSEYDYYSIDFQGASVEMDDIVEAIHKQCKETKDSYCTFTIPDEDNEEETAFGVRSFDAEQCKGGKRFCHGKGNFPMIIPKNPKGYACLDVESLPNFKSDLPLKAWTCMQDGGCECGGKKCPNNAACIDETCYCGKDTVTENDTCSLYCTNEDCSSYRIGLRCTDDACACGSTKCARGEICRDGQCYCDYKPSLGTDYVCSVLENSVYTFFEDPLNNREPMKCIQKCNKPEGCACGGVTCPQNATCDNNKCLCGSSQVTPEIIGFACIDDQADNYHLECTADDCSCYGKKMKKKETCAPEECNRYSKPGPKGCMCGDQVIETDDYSCEPGKNGKLVQVCIDDSTCLCGGEECDPLAVCYKGQCVDRATLKPLSDGYRFSYGLLQCNRPEGCACGKTQCEENKYCMNGLCFRDPFTKKFDDKIYYYRFVRTYEFQDNIVAQSILYEDENKTVSQYEQELKTYSSDIIIRGHENLNKNMTIGELLKTCGGGSIPKDVATKYCYIRLNLEQGQCGGDHVLEFSGWQDEDYWHRVHHCDFDWEPEVKRPVG